MAASGLAVLLRIGWRLSDISGFDIRLRWLLIRVPFGQAVRLPVRVARGYNVGILNWFVRCGCHALTSTQTRRANAIPVDAQNTHIRRSAAIRALMSMSGRATERATRRTFVVGGPGPLRDSPSP